MGKFLLLALLAVPLSSAPAAAQCHPAWDLASDWSDAANPNGTWSYNAGAAPIIVHQANWAGTGNPAWAAASTGIGHVPSWMRITHAGQPQLGPHAVAGVVMMHGNDPTSGTGVDLANVTWTAPAAGNFLLHGDVWHSDQHPRDTLWRVSFNAVLLDSGVLSQGDVYNPLTPRSFDFPISVAPGDVVKLEFERSDPFGTFVCMRLAITPHALFLRSPVPGAAGSNSTIQLRGATPNGRVMVAYSAATGAFTVPGCGGLQLCLRAPRLAHSLTANAAGQVSFVAPIPLGLSGREMLLQAAEPGACQVSNRVRHTF
jgi:hypothetical protein